ncbi:hypothetical protein ALC53_02229, partial [Atta colombica]
IFIPKLMNTIKWRFTFSVTATLGIFHRNSQIAIKNEALQPHIRTKNTPPRPAIPNSYNDAVAPPFSIPYLIFVCLAKSSIPLTGMPILSTVRKAARFAVYKLYMIKVKNHHMLASMRRDDVL